jgi:hypothetical protein
MIDENVLQEDYLTLKKLAIKYFKQSNYLLCLKKINQATLLAYNYNLSKSYGDDDLERLIIEIAKKKLTHNHSENLNIDSIVFYDYFGWDSRGLTQQYLYALTQLNLKILYITRFKLKKEKSSNILSYIGNNSNITLESVPENLDELQAAQFVINKIKDFKPSKAFLHLSPWDIVALLAFSGQTKITKYFINITDHSFWLGKNIIDFCLEFRNFGYQLSTRYRGLNVKKCHIIPYYPIIQEHNEFQGLPQQLKDKTVLVCGGSAYKFLGDDNAFYKLIVPILKKYKNTILLIIGAKILESKFLSMAKVDGVKNQFYFMEDTPDISEVIKHCDIYISSYPISGGLMAQIAAKVGKPILSFTKESLPLNRLEDLVPYCNDKFKTCTNLKEFEKTADLLIEDLEFRAEYAGYTSGKLVNEKQFLSFIKDLLSGNYVNEIIPVKEILFSRNTITKILIEQKTIAEYENYFYSTLDRTDLINTSFKNKLRILAYKIRKKFFE